MRPDDLFCCIVAFIFGYWTVACAQYWFYMLVQVAPISIT